MRRRRVLITGIADGLGAAIVTTFASAGCEVVGLSRSDRSVPRVRQAVAAVGGTYAHIACDLMQAEAVAIALEPHADSIDVLIHNAQALLIKPFMETAAAEFEHAWRVACLGAVVATRIVMPHMVARRRGTIILTGATAGLRGRANFAAFASAKFALRGLAQSLAREFGPQGVHIAHVVLDGLIDEPQTDRRFGASLTGRMSPEAIAQVYLDIANQPPSAWTHELDLRPFSESF